MRVYIASLSDYNNGRLEGKWFNLSYFADASQLMDAINDMLNNLTEKYKDVDGEVREEWAVHDYEGIPPTLASEYMGEEDFQKLFDIEEVAQDRDIPVEVLVERAGDTGSDDYQSLADSLVMVVDGSDETDIVYELEDQLGELGNDFWKDYIFIDDVTERVMYGEDVDRYREDILYENPDMDEEEAERQAEEMADEEADRRRDLSTYLEDMGYGDEIPDFVTKDYNDAWKYALSYDYDVIHHDGEMYVFTNNYSLGGTILSGLVGAYIGYKIGRAKPQKKGFETEKKIGRKIKGALTKKKMANGGGVAQYPNDLPKAEAERLFHLAHKNAKVGGRLWNNFKRTPLRLIYSNMEDRGIKYAKGGGIELPTSPNQRKNKTYYQVIWDNGQSIEDVTFENKEDAENLFDSLVKQNFEPIQLSSNSFNQYGWLEKHNTYKMHPKFAKGGGIGFKALSNKVAKRYEGKKPSAKYRAEYGKRYSKSEAKEVGDKVAGKVYWQQKGRKMAEGGKILQEISTHKAVKKGDKIYIYIKGMPIENAEDKRLAKKYPHWFKDELIRTIPAENEDDLFYIFENYEEENRSNLSGYARGGQIGQEIVFDDNGEENTGVIKDITNLGDYVVKSDDGRTLLAQKDLDVISLGAMRSASTEAPRKRFGFFEDGGGVDYPNHYLEVEDLNKKINALTQQIEADYRNNEIDNYTDRNERELVRLKERLDWLMWGKDSYSQGGGISGIDDLIRG